MVVRCHAFLIDVDQPTGGFSHQQKTLRFHTYSNIGYNIGVGSHVPF